MNVFICSLNVEFQFLITNRYAGCNFWKIYNLAQWLKFSYGGVNHHIIFI